MLLLLWECHPVHRIRTTPTKRTRVYMTEHAENWYGAGRRMWNRVWECMQFHASYVRVMKIKIKRLITSHGPTSIREKHRSIEKCHHRARVEVWWYWIGTFHVAEKTKCHLKMEKLSEFSSQIDEDGWNCVWTRVEALPPPPPNKREKLKFIQASLGRVSFRYSSRVVGRRWGESRLKFELTIQSDTDSRRSGSTSSRQQKKKKNSPRERKFLVVGSG